MIVPSHSRAPAMLQRFNMWCLANRHSLPLCYLLSTTLQTLAIADWAHQTKLNALMVTTFSLVAQSRALGMGMARWAYTWHDYHKDCDRLIQRWHSKARGHCARLEASANRQQAATDDSVDNQLVSTQRPPWLPAQLWFEVTWRLRLYATQCRLCSLHRMHGRPAAQIVQESPPVGPTLVPVPQWWRCDIPLCLPDAADWPVVEVSRESPRPAGRSSYKKARRPAAHSASRACDLVAPHTAPLNSTTSDMDPWVVLDTTGKQLPWSGSTLDLNSPRQRPWSGAALASPPWDLALPDPSSPVTTHGCLWYHDNDID